MQRNIHFLTGLAAIAMALSAGGVSAQTDSSQDIAGAGRGTYSDDLQRSTEIYAFQEAAPSGPARGQEIYYYRCWTCHNSYTNAAGSPAPMLEGLYERETLTLSGEPVNDENVAQKIRDGGALMPGFKYTMSDDDIGDILSYLKSGECCIASGEVNLPANPDYTASP